MTLNCSLLETFLAILKIQKNDKNKYGGKIEFKNVSKTDIFVIKVFPSTHFPPKKLCVDGNEAKQLFPFSFSIVKSDINQELPTFSHLYCPHVLSLAMMPK